MTERDDDAQPGSQTPGTPDQGYTQHIPIPQHPGPRQSPYPPTGMPADFAQTQYAQRPPDPGQAVPSPGGQSPNPQYTSPQYTNPQYTNPEFPAGQPQPYPGAPWYGGPAVSPMTGQAQYGGYPVAVPAPDDAIREAPALWTAVGFGVLGVISAFLPWVAIGDLLSKNGTEGDGVLTLILSVIALVALGVALFGSAGRPRIRTVGAVTALVAGVLVALIAIVDIVDANQKFEDAAAFGIDASISIGLWLTLVAGIGLAAAAVAALVMRSSARR